MAGSRVNWPSRGFVVFYLFIYFNEVTLGSDPSPGLEGLDYIMRGLERVLKNGGGGSRQQVPGLDNCNHGNGCTGQHWLSLGSSLFGKIKHFPVHGLTLNGMIYFWLTLICILLLFHSYLFLFLINTTPPKHCFSYIDQFL